MSVQEPCRFCGGSGIAKSSNEDTLLAENEMLKERILGLESKLESYRKSENDSRIESRIRSCVACNNTKKIKILFPSEDEIDCPFCGDMKNEN